MCTDHSRLLQWYKEDLCTFSGLLGHQRRWHEFSSRFNLHIESLPGERNEVGDTLSRWAYTAGELQDSTFHGSTMDAEGWAMDDQREQARTRDCVQQEYSGEFLLPVTLAPLSVSTFPLPSPECYVSSLTDTIQFTCTHNFMSLCCIPPLMYVLLMNLPLLHMWLLCVTFHGTCRGQCSMPSLS